MSQSSLLRNVPEGPFVVPALRPPVLGLSIILPTYNEANNIAAAIATLRDVLSNIPGLTYEILVVDDDSPDQTWRLALEQASRFQEVGVLRRIGERGLATAVVRGWQAARGDFLAVIDADLQHPLEITAQLVALVRQGADLAVASRHIEGGGVSDWNILRRMISRGAQLIGLLLLPEVLSRLSDPMSGCFVLRRSVIEGIRLYPAGYKILIEVLARGRVGTIREASYVFRERESGASKASYRVYVQYLTQLLSLRWNLLRQSLRRAAKP